MIDRIDLPIEVPALSTDDLLMALAGESSPLMRARCVAACERAPLRQGKTNKALADQEIDLHARLDPATAQFLRATAVRLGWLVRSLHRTLKVARAIADLAESAAIKMIHAAEAMQYRHASTLEY